MDGWMDGSVDEWIDGWMDGSVDEWIDGWKNGLQKVPMQATRLTHKGDRQIDR